MPKTLSLADSLESIGACDEACEWVGGRDLKTAWYECDRPDWMLWLCGRMAGKPEWPTRQQIVLFACDIAESVLPIFEIRRPGDNRPRAAIETARKWANGDADIKEVRAARKAAAAAAAYAYAAARSKKRAEICALIRDRLQIPEVL